MRKRKCIAILVLQGLLEVDKNPRGKTRSWIRKRESRGFYTNIVRELMVEDTAAYREMMRMSYNDFKVLLRVVEPHISPHQVQGGQKVIPALERLTSTIRFLATGGTYRSLCFQFRISVAAISYIVKEVCEAIVKHIGPLYLKVPSTTEEWLEIAAKFEERWNYPNCVGAIDGKHIVMQPPANAGLFFYNYKHTHSIVLMAVAGPDYECIYADVGTNGRVADGGVWNKCSLSKSIDDGAISLPSARCLPFGVTKIPYLIVADDAFALKPNVMKPHPQQSLTEDKRIYNYRHSRARRISENLFGIIANRWRVIRGIILLPPETIESVIMAILVLQNYLRKSISSKASYCPVGLLDTEDPTGGFVQGLWRQESMSESLLPLSVSPTGHNASNNAKLVRETLKDYFFAEGSVDWQWNFC